MHRQATAAYHHRQVAVGGGQWDQNQGYYPGVNQLTLAPGQQVVYPQGMQGPPLIFNPSLSPAAGGYGYI